MQLIGELPLSELSGLTSYAEKREAEEATRNLYIAHFMLQKMSGAEPMGYEEYLSQVMTTAGEKAKTRDPSDIEAEISRIEAEYRARKEA